MVIVTKITDESMYSEWYRLENWQCFRHALLHKANTNHLIGKQKLPPSPLNKLFTFFLLLEKLNTMIHLIDELSLSSEADVIAFTINCPAHAKYNSRLWLVATLLWLCHASDVAAYALSLNGHASHIYATMHLFPNG